MQQSQSEQPNINLKNTKAIKTDDGGNIFEQGILLRTVSRFITGSNEDGLIPIPVFYDGKSGKIVGSTIPPEIREEYKDQIL